jgi:glycine cleavage system H protein
METTSLKYLKSHEWFSVADGVATVGVSDFAQEQLNDVVFVELPEVGRTVAKGESCCVLESCKAASDVYSPVAGEVVAANDALGDAPEKVNKAPLGDGWLFKVKLDGSFNANDAAYMDKAAYDKSCQG